MKRLFLFLILAGMLIGGASAEMIDISGVTEFNYTAPPYYTIYEVTLADLQEGTATLELDAYGEIYGIEIDCERSWGWWNFDINVTYPNATVVSDSYSILQPLATNYDLIIQHTDTVDLGIFLDVDMFLDFEPYYFGPLRLLPYGRNNLYFADIEGTAPNPATVYIHIGDEETISDIESGDWVSTAFRAIGDSGKYILEWTWAQVLNFVSLIPYVGEYFVAILELTGATIVELLWYFNFFVIEEPEITFCLAECFILGHAIISGRSLIRMLQLVYADHVKLINGMIAVIEIIFNLIMRVIDVVSSIVETLKPV